MDKKIDNQLRITLTDVCETALKEIDGFQWITHLANYSNFPKSLRVICIFNTNEELSTFMGGGGEKSLTLLIESKLNTMGVRFKSVAAHISYDTEENCTKENNGNWAIRLG
ncbi:Fis family transcriptional regulator [Photobacterium minamisatsumaniensis]|uniref:Fis family transcriptional regulator n=1 Tax=Photobacterium minamisatsumaniensis TaxID=2910233 RepID=UPI003D117487